MSWWYWTCFANIRLKSRPSFFSPPEAVGCLPSSSVDVHPFRHIRWYVPSWPVSGGRSIPRAHLGSQPWTGPFTRLCPQYDGTQSWTWNTKRTSRHAGPGTKWLLSGQHVSYAQGTAWPAAVKCLLMSQLHKDSVVVILNLCDVFRLSCYCLV